MARSAATSSASHVYQVPGSYDVVVSATDEDGTTTAEDFTILVQNADPIIERVGVSSPIVEGSTFTMSVVASDDGGAGALEYSIDATGNLRRQVISH